MIIEIKVPSPGESISEVEIANWFVADGDYVEKDQEIVEIESDKATLPLSAPESGQINLVKTTGVTIAVGEVICKIDTSKTGTKQVTPPKQKEKETDPNKAKDKMEVDAENVEVDTDKAKDEIETAKKKTSLPVDKPEITKPLEKQRISNDNSNLIRITPVAKQIMDENNLSIDDILKGLKKISSREVNAVINSQQNKTQPSSEMQLGGREEKRSRMGVFRRKLSQRLVSTKNETALLTTFNEVDMSQILEIRSKYQDAFIEKYNVKLGFMSFFTKAVTEALSAFPMVNSRIEGEEVITPGFVDVGIAVQTEKGLMVPILRNTESMNFAQIEKKIVELADKARNNKITIEEMTGGTFTITNGGIYGSMLSTPILNSPQSAILGMHNIIERPVALNGQVVIRPMMYLALSYDHRIIDGRDSVSFLVKVKEMIEDPKKILFGGNDPGKILLGLDS